MSLVGAVITIMSPSSGEASGPSNTSSLRLIPFGHGS